MKQKNITTLRRDLRQRADPARADACRRFFKTGPGAYGEGDRFIGVSMPEIRALVRAYAGLPRSDVVKFLPSPIHEERMLGLLLLVEQFRRGSLDEQREIYRIYLSHTRYINNWDLVDVTAPTIVGGWLSDKSRKPLYRLAASGDLWERRISILATFAFIRKHDFSDTLLIAERLLKDDHDLIHKAVGWMLREVGNRDRSVEEQFLKCHYRTMPRVLLRYAIEKFPEPRRQAYLKGTV